MAATLLLLSMTDHPRNCKGSAFQSCAGPAREHDQVEARLVTHLVRRSPRALSRLSSLAYSSKRNAPLRTLVSATDPLVTAKSRFASPPHCLTTFLNGMGEERKRKLSSLAFTEADKETINKFAATHPAWDGKLPLPELLQQLNQPIKRFNTTQLSKLLHSYQISIAAGLRMSSLLDCSLTHSLCSNSNHTTGTGCHRPSLPRARRSGCTNRPQRSHPPCLSICQWRSSPCTGGRL